ncbi:MAG: class I SAM-dependent methyltransferase [Bryobacterales bacterium]|nr:class I SAM-dependent methyltransferase [Bryobacterales bacterium]
MRVPSGDLSDVTRYVDNHRHITLTDKTVHFENLLAYVRPFHTLDANTKMVEVGTGTGWFPIMCKMKGLNCKGLEISPQLVEYAREFGRANGVEPDIEVGNIEEGNLGTGVYDVVIASSVFEHVENWRLGLKHVYQALKPGGVLFFESTNKFSFTSGEYPSMPCYGWLPNWARYRFRMAVQGRDIMENGIDFHQFTYIGLRRAFREVGFRRILDRVQVADPESVSSPLKRNVLKLCKKVPLAKEATLFFFEGTTFVCIK